MKMRLLATFLLIVSVSTHYSYSQAIDDSDTGKINPEDLTDQDRHTSENYIHEGLANRTKTELCGENSDSQKACDGQAAEKKFMGMNPSMVGALSKAYTLVIGTSSLGSKLVTQAESDKKAADKKAAEGNDTKTEAPAETKPDPNSESVAEDGAGDTGKKKEKTDNDDYCRYIPLVTETVATFQQQSSGDSIKDIPTNQDTAQKDNMYKVAMSHEDRADISKMQMTGWGASTACYAAMMARPSISKSAWQNWAKLAASGLMASFFKSQVDAHEDYAGKVRTIADKLPGKGDCNPITDRACYCAQEETMYDTNHCSDEIKTRALAQAQDLSVTCVDSKLKADPNCNCVTSDTCYSKTFEHNVSGLDLSGAFKTNVLDPVGSLSKGVLKSGKLESGDSKLFAISQRELKKAKKYLAKNKNLSKAQTAEAKAFEKLGLDKSMAQRLASLPTTPEMKKNQGLIRRAGYSPNRRRTYRRSNNSNSKVLTFGGGSGLKNKKYYKKRNSPNYLKGLRKKKTSKASGKVLKFAQRAENQAQISSHTDKPIFDIISRRYKVSAWKRLELK